MIVAVLTPRNSMEIEVDSQTVLPRPLECLEDVLPCDLFEERLVGVLLDGPVGNGETDPVETCAGHASEIFLGLEVGWVRDWGRERRGRVTYDEGIVVLFDGVEVSYVCHHGLRESVFVDHAGDVFVRFEQGWDDEGFWY